MTTLFKETETCLVCGQSHDYVGIGSTNRFGSPDLDTRPPEMMRSTMPYWIRCCPSCGYCAPRVSEGPELVKSVVRAERYVRQRDDPAFPELANSFLCWAIVQEELGDLAGAGWAALRAAWACDDQGTPEAARQCRLRAVELFRQARAKGASFMEGRGDEQALLADLLRRSGQFEQVEAICQEGLQANPSKTIRDMLTFQKALALRKDDKRHRIEEAVEQPPRSVRGRSLPQGKAIRRSS